MSLGQRRSLRKPTGPAPRGNFWGKLEEALEDEGFDRFVEELVRPFYASRRGRPSIAPGVYFRMLLVGAIEGIASQRELAWRCADSLTLRRFLGFAPADPTPDHSTLTLIRQRLPAVVHEQALRFMLRAARAHEVLRGRSLSIDADFFTARSIALPESAGALMPKDR